LFFSYNCFVPLIVFQVYLQRLKSGKNFLTYAKVNFNAHPRLGQRILFCCD
jgi:hypothetical protein